MKYII